jgi:two-component sensor histidine kinase
MTDHSPTLSPLDDPTSLATALPFMTWTWCAATGRMETSPALLSFTGQTADEARGAGWLEAVHPDDRVAVADPAAAAPGSREYRMRRADGAYATVVDEIRPAVGAGETVLIGFTVDVTGLRHANAIQREDAQRLHAIAQHVPGVVYSYDFHPDGSRALHYLGPGLEEIIGPGLAARVQDDFDHLFALLHPDDRARVKATADARATTGEVLDLEARLRTDDGEYTWVRSVTRAQPTGDGRYRWHVVLIDVNERKRVEARQHLLLRELDHRVKNNMAAVLSLADQSIRNASSLEDFRSVFTGRIQSLAATHEALARRHWDGVDLREAVSLTIAPYVRDRESAVSMSGADVLLDSRTALPLGLVLHELATNATKHGALGGTGGHLAIAWSRRDDGTIVLSWNEAGGPPVSPDPAPGLGLSLVRGLVEGEIKGRLDLDFRPDGLRATVELPSS